MTKKRCSKCSVSQDVSNFGKHKFTRDGLKSWCNACNTKAAIAYKKAHPAKVKRNSALYYERHRDEITIKRREYAATHREEKRLRDREYAATHREEAREKSKKWYAENKEKVSIAGRLYRAINSKAIKARKSKYDKEHRAEKNARENARRVKKKGNGGEYTKAEFKELCERYGNRCLMCGRTDVKLSVDHVIPISLGGSNSIDNIQPLCISCNSKKHNTTIDFR